jgi:hypothetical protein
MAAFTFKGRPVTVGVITFGEMMDANTMQEKTGRQQDALWYVTHCAARYADGDCEKVFPTFDDVRAMPATEAGNIMRISSEAARLNMPNVEELKNPT